MLQRRRGCRRRTLLIEALEGRTLLSTSSFVAAGPDGRLVYTPNAQGDVIPDFSMVGYETGDVALPDTAGGVAVPVMESINPGAAGVDQTATIQNAINAVSAMTIQPNGFRGAVLLTAGNYPISGTLNINANGVVLIGQGDDPNTGTRLEATGSTLRFLIDIEGSGSMSTVSNSTHNITNSYVPVGATSFTVDSTANLHVGSTVIVTRPSTQNWIDDIGMNLLTNPWTPGSKNLDSDRVITAINGNTITIDAPLTNSLDQQYGGGTIQAYTWSGRIQQVGLMNMYTYSDSLTSTDPNHATGVLTMDAVQNAWVYNITTNNFSVNNVETGGGVKWTTFDDDSLGNQTQTTGNIADAPAGIGIGGQEILVENTTFPNAFHAIAVGASVPGPNVYTNITINDPLEGAMNLPHSRDETGPHQRWSTGGLFDNVTDTDWINIRNAGNEGSGHGWQGANYVFWNVNARTDISSPPTAQNWVIGGTGSTSEGTAIYDQRGSTMFPQSLYATQLWDRLHADPTVATAASASPNPLTGTSATLSVLGTSDDDESNLTYTWSTAYKPAGAANPTFSANGTNAAKNTTATLSVIGTYLFVVTIQDPGGLQTTSTVIVSNDPALAINGDQDSTNENDTIRIVRSGSVIDIFRNNTVTPILQQTFSTSPLLVISPAGGTDSVIIDYSGGDPIPVDGLIVNSANGSNDTISVVTTTSNDAVTLASGSVSVNGEPFGYVGAQELDLALGVGLDTITANGDASVSVGRLAVNVSGGGTLSMGASSTLPDFTDLTVTGATFDLAGQNQAIDSLNGSGTVTDTGAAATFTVGADGGSGVFSGSLTNGGGVLSLTKTGVGTLTLSGTNSYTGSTTISGGVIASGNSASLVGLTGKLIFNTGTLLVTANSAAASMANKFTTSFTGATSSATGTIDVAPGVTLTIGATGGPASLQTNGGGGHGGDFTVTGGGTLKILSNNGQQDNAFHLASGTIDLESATGLGGGDSGVVLDASSGTTLILKQDTATNFLTPIDMVDVGGTLNVVIDRLTAGAGVTHSLNALSSAGAFTLNVTAGPNVTSGVAGFVLGAVTLGGDGSFNIGNGVLTTVSGVVSGAFAVNLSGLGTLDLQGVDTYSGATNVNGGTMIVDTAGSLASTGVTVAAGAALSVKGSLSSTTTLTSNGSTTFATGPASRTLGGITIGSVGSVVVANPPIHASRTVLIVGSLTFSAGTGKLDLAGNDMIVHNGNLVQITSEIGQGYNLGHWNGAGGIESSTAAGTSNTALGVELNSANGSPLLATFDGQTAAMTDVLVKYTYYGDADLSGAVNSADYSLIDNGLIMSLSGWRNGDFNYDNQINGDDYTLIDNAFNTQGGVSLAIVAAPTLQVSSGGPPNG